MRARTRFCARTTLFLPRIERETRMNVVISDEKFHEFRDRVDTSRLPLGNTRSHYNFFIALDVHSRVRRRNNLILQTQRWPSLENRSLKRAETSRFCFPLILRVGDTVLRANTVPLVENVTPGFFQAGTIKRRRIVESEGSGTGWAKRPGQTNQTSKYRNGSNTKLHNLWRAFNIKTLLGRAGVSSARAERGR